MTINKIILSRVDSLGDVILSLPVAGAIKKYNTQIKILFIGRTYSKSIIEASEFIDEFINADELLSKNVAEQLIYFTGLKADAIVHLFPNRNLAKLAKKAKIPFRIGTSHRYFHLLTCNKTVNLGRKNSNLHECELNLKLLAPLGIKYDYTLEQIPELYGFNKFVKLNNKINNLISSARFNLILHPKSKGSAREWGLDNFSNLINLLPKDKFKVFLTGTKEDGAMLQSFINKHDSQITDLTGKLSLDELVSFISKVDGLVAASTGPLHIAAATGIKAIGIYAPMRPIHPGRWKPIGKFADFIVLNKNCNNCKHGGSCECILSVTPQQVYQKLIGYQ